MRNNSIFDDVLGPVMRGPSSSHTAGAHRIGRLALSLFGRRPRSVVCRFDPKGSMATTYAPLAVDRAFGAGLLEWDLLDTRFAEALQHVRREGIELSYEVAPFPEADHPNAFDIRMVASDGEGLRILAKSTGGGAVEITSVAGYPVEIHGGHHETLLETNAGEVEEVARLAGARPPEDSPRDGVEAIALQISRRQPLVPAERERVTKHPAVRNVWSARPILHVQQGEPLFSSSAEIVRLAAERGASLGHMGLLYECQLLGISHEEAQAEMARRYKVMAGSVDRGLKAEGLGMQFLDPSAGALLDAEARGALAVGGLHTRAAARAMAVMHVSNSLGIVCAAPTGGSAGVLPGVLVTLAEEKGLTERELTAAMFAASAVGLVVARRATFAAETAGCQVEIGVAGAMAAAAVVELAGGEPTEAIAAAAIALQNTMGSVCDPVQGACEIPCHTRNAVAASSAFVCADLILGGYANPIPLDETIDASLAVGRCLPSELRCTALGGIAASPAAKALKSRW